MRLAPVSTRSAASTTRTTAWSSTARGTSRATSCASSHWSRRAARPSASAWASDTELRTVDCTAGDSLTACHRRGPAGVYLRIKDLSRGRHHDRLGRAAEGRHGRCLIACQLDIAAGTGVRLTDLVLWHSAIENRGQLVIDRVVGNTGACVRNRGTLTAIDSDLRRGGCPGMVTVMNDNGASMTLRDTRLGGERLVELWIGDAAGCHDVRCHTAHRQFGRCGHRRVEVHRQHGGVQPRQCPDELRGSDSG